MCAMTQLTCACLGWFLNQSWTLSLAKPHKCNTDEVGHSILVVCAFALRDVDTEWKVLFWWLDWDFTSLFLRQKLLGKYHSYIEGKFSFLWYFCYCHCCFNKRKQRKGSIWNPFSSGDQPWPVWLSRLSINPESERSLVRAWLGHLREATNWCFSHTLMFLSFSFFLPSPLSKKKNK